MHAEELETHACPTEHSEVLPSAAPCASESTSSSAPVVSRWGDFFVAQPEDRRLTYFGDLLKRTGCTAVSDVALLPAVFDWRRP